MHFTQRLFNTLPTFFKLEWSSKILKIEAIKIFLTTFFSTYFDQNLHTDFQIKCTNQKYQYWMDSNTTSSSINYYTRAALENIYCITILDVYYVWWCCAWTYQRYQHQPSKLLSLDQTHHIVQAAFAAFADDRGRDVHTRPHQGVQLLDDVSQNQDGAVFTHLP